MPRIQTYIKTNQPTNENAAMAALLRTGRRNYAWVLIAATLSHHGGADVAVAPLADTYFEHGAAAASVREDFAILTSAGPHENLLHMCHLALAVSPATVPSLANGLLPARRSPHHATVVTILRNMIEHGSSRPDVCSQLVHQRETLLAASTPPSSPPSPDSTRADAEAELIMADVAAFSPPLIRNR